MSSLSATQVYPASAFHMLPLALPEPEETKACSQKGRHPQLQCWWVLHQIWWNYRYILFYFYCSSSSWGSFFPCLTLWIFLLLYFINILVVLSRLIGIICFSSQESVQMVMSAHVCTELQGTQSGVTTWDITKQHRVFMKQTAEDSVSKTAYTVLLLTAMLICAILYTTFVIWGLVILICFSAKPSFCMSIIWIKKKII